MLLEELCENLGRVRCADDGVVPLRDEIGEQLDDGIHDLSPVLGREASGSDLHLSHERTMLEKLFKDVRARIAWMKKRILQLLTEKGILVDPEAAEALSRLQDPMACVDRILKDAENQPLILSREVVDGLAECVAQQPALSQESVPRPAPERPAFNKT